MRNYGIMNVTSGLRSGGNGHEGRSLHGKYAPANSRFPSSSLPLKRGKFSQALIDVLAALSLLLLACDGVVAIGASIRILFSFIHVELG